MPRNRSAIDNAESNFCVLSSKAGEGHLLYSMAVAANMNILTTPHSAIGSTLKGINFLGVIIIFSLLTSCYTEKGRYLKALSTEEKEILDQRGVVVTDHKSFNKSMKLTRVGKLKIVKDGKDYMFIKIGRWVDYEPDGFESEISNFDENGQLLNFTNYDFNKNLDVYIEYYMDTLDGDVIQFGKGYKYFPSGKIKEVFTEYWQGDRSIKHGYLIKYDQLGIAVDTTEYFKGKKK